MFEHSCAAAVCENNQPIIVKVHLLIFLLYQKIMNSLSKWAGSDSPSVHVTEGKKSPKFAKASTANAGAWALEAPPSPLGEPAHLHLKRHTQKWCVKRHTQKWCVLAHTLKVAILTSYKKLSVGYFEVKLHIHTLRISETYFTSCKKEHNRSPLKRQCVITVPQASSNRTDCVQTGFRNTVKVWESQEWDHMLHPYCQQAMHQNRKWV